MSVIFGGKLIAQKKQSALDDYDDPNYGIKLLSKREKSLLAELDKTRSEIVSELVTLGPSVSTGDLENWHNTINTYESQINNIDHINSTFSSYNSHKRHKKKKTRSQTSVGKKLKALGRSSISDQNFSKTVTGLDFLPSLSTSSLTAVGGISKHRKDSSSQPFRLPVLSLPSLGSDNTNSSLSLVADDNFPLEQFPSDGGLSCQSRAGLFLEDLDRYYIQQYLEISNEQMEEILLDLDAILLGGVSPSACDQSRPSVFNAVKLECSHAPKEAHLTPLPTSTSSKYTTSTVSGTRSVTFSRRSSSSSALALTNKTKQFNKSRRSKRAHEAWSENHINDLNSIDSLRAELMKSLGNMQQHTSEVKHGILHVQEIVSLTNPKAKSFISTMAADQLFAVIKKIGTRQIRRGWDAWKLNIKNQNLVYKAVLFKRFEHIRDLARLLDRLVCQAIGAKFFQWARFCVTMRTHEEMELKTAAVLLVQRVARGISDRVRVKKMKENKTFTRMHDSLVKLQAIFRCKLQHWKYKRYRRSVLEDSSIRLLQRVIRGHLGRRKASKVRLFQNKELNAVAIQAALRGLFGRRLAAVRRLQRLQGKMALLIQVVARGYIARMRVVKIKRDRVERAAVVLIQTRVRGALARMNLFRRRKEAAEYQKERGRLVKLIQAVYRGHQARILFRYYMQERNELRALQNETAVVLQCFVRRFVARARVRKLREQQYDTWVANAMSWKEMWAEDSSSWFYFNEKTEEALWEPPSGGYKKSDGQLVLESGEIIDEPDMMGKRKRAVGEEHLCVECVSRVAIRACGECGDGFCTKCFKRTHAGGSRKDHTWKPAGPIDCSECEEELAERWCVSCDEAYCDSCWRKVHSHGKRRFHPFSQVQEDGHIDNRIFTIDGEQVLNYDASYAQTRHEDDRQNESNIDADVQDLFGSMEVKDATEQDNEDFIVEQYDAPPELEEGGQYTNVDSYAVADAPDGTEEEWTQYFDDDGNPYWYNNYTGISQYEDPF